MWNDSQLHPQVNHKYWYLNHSDSPVYSQDMSKIQKDPRNAFLRQRKRRHPIPFKEFKTHHLSGDNLDSDQDDLDVSSLEPLHGPQVIRLIMSSEQTLFLGLLAFRVINALILQTSFVPDEYWQSIEVAHNMAFRWVLVNLFNCDWGNSPAAATEPRPGNGGMGSEATCTRSYLPFRIKY